MYVVMFALILAAQEYSTLLSQSILLCTETNILFHSPLLNKRASIAAMCIFSEVVWKCLPALFLVLTRLSMFMDALQSQSVSTYPVVTYEFKCSSDTWSLSLSFLTITVLSIVWCACCIFPLALVYLYGP